MSEIRRTAVRIQQGKRTLYLTSFTVRDFLADDFFRVDYLDVQSAKGMQRLLNESRARSFGNDLVAADKVNEAFLPTSIFLATDGSISYDERTQELYFDPSLTDGVCPFDVVDGQHRLEGLKRAGEKVERFLDFPISVVIAPNMSETEKMLQFVTVNTKQKAVDKGVVQHITARFTRMLEVEELPYIPTWLKREVDKGGDDRGLAIATHLNNDDQSPWQGRIQFADETKVPRHTVTQKTFVGALKRTVLNKYHPLNDNVPDLDKQLRVLTNYWNAIDDIFVADVDQPTGKSAPVVYKYNGIEFFLQILSPAVNVLAGERKFTRDAFKHCFQKSREYLPPESAAALDPEYWRPGGVASGQNRAGIGHLAGDFAEAIKAAAEQDVEI